MAIKSVKRKYASIGATGELEGRRTYKEVWVVITDGVGISPATISADGRVPRKFAGYPSDPGAVCIKQDYDELDGNVWLVTCNYDTESDDPERDSTSEQTAWPPRFSIGSTPYEKVLSKDFNTAVHDEGNPFLNSANQPLDEQSAAVDDSRLILTIQRVELVFPIEKAVVYQKTINKFTMQIGGSTFPPLTLLLYSISGSDGWQGGDHFWDVNYEFHIDRQTWIRKVLDKGAYYYQGDDTSDEDKKTYFSDENPSEEGLLNGLGGKLPDGEDPMYLAFDVYERKNHRLILNL